MRSRVLLFVGILLLLAACASQPVAAPEAEPPTAQPSFVNSVAASPTVEIAPTQAPMQAETSTPRPNLDAWMKMPAVPSEISERAQEIFAYGQTRGNHADVFMKIGDSNSTTTWFLGPFGRGEYSLGDEYADLQPAIDTFQTSFLRNSVTVGRGFNASTILSSLWADKDQCEPQETPLDCELRLMKPAYAFVMLGTNDYTRMEQFEPNMRLIIERLIEAGVVPILSTKGDNLEGDHQVNRTIAALADEYEIPLWNLWAALQLLENHGAQADDPAHLTWTGCYFDEPETMTYGWPWRNLTALQVIDKVWRDVQP